MPGAEAPVPARRLRVALSWVLGSVGAAVFAAGGLERWFGGFDTVRSSTGAWILAHVDLVGRVGDHVAAVVASQIPNTTYDPLLPALLWAWGAASGAADPAALVVTAHRLSAAGVGLCLVALGGFWSSVAGGGGAVGGRSRVAVAALGTVAGLFPPLLATGGLVRPDTLACALTLAAVNAAVRARRAGGGAWFLAGLLAGLTYLAREYTIGPALGAVVVAWLLAARRARDWRRAAGSALAVALGLWVGAVPLCLALGLSPLGGLDALVGYGGGGRAGAGPASVASLLYLDVLPIPLALASAGWVRALWCAPDRGAVLVGLGGLLPFGAFLWSAQQSPQYYLLGHVLFLSGIAGLGLCGRRWPVPLALAGVALALALPAVRAETPRLLQADHNRNPRLHSEGWPCRPEEPVAIIDRAMATVEQHPLLISSGRVENIDALVPLWHRRPAAFVYPNWQDRVAEIVRLYDGAPVYYLSVEGRADPHPLPGDALVVDRWETAELSAVLALLPGRPARVGEDPCAHGGPVRGACLQRAWLQEGDAGLVAWARARGRDFEQRLTASTRWW